MSLASAYAADQHDVALLGDKAAGGKIIDQRLVKRKRSFAAVLISA
ncbi:hypothetical protein M2226_004785 [Bradyrhizobium elkanii]|nr:hypothetical protein [Bradyrhizobium elkanii]MCS3475091.1 hypothetical protein [Bradyrhizobium elkanii]MCS3521102.1 hypothetical protein [Bradyrhizobium elkanii]MCS4068757.1 hypothetical protein [Bradyrhizobium elkanii]MCS4084291.1 hypothetical protein [Bradyrhizobium elkanii]